MMDTSGIFRVIFTCFLQYLSLTNKKFKECEETLKASIKISENNHLIVIDTEGLGSMDVNKNQDSMIILLSILISSYFIYNTIGTIDENSFNDLRYIYNFYK